MINSENKPEENSKTPDGSIPEMVTRVRKFYEELGREDVKAVQEWEENERKLREADAKIEPKPNANEEPKEEIKPAVKEDAKPEVKVEPNTKEELSLDAKDKAKDASIEEIKPAVKEDAKPEVKIEPNKTDELLMDAKDKAKDASIEEIKPAVKEDAKPEVKVEPNTKEELSLDAKDKAKDASKEEIKPAVKEDAKPEVKVEPNIKDEILFDAKDNVNNELKKEIKPVVSDEAKVKSETKDELPPDAKDKDKDKPETDIKDEVKQEVKVDSNPEKEIEKMNVSFHSISQNDMAKTFNVNSETGLDSAEIQNRLNTFGRNVITHEKKKNPWIILLQQFRSPIVYLLLVAAGLSFFFKEWLEGIAIIIVILINALIGFFMEFQANRSMETLKKLGVISTRVLRNGKISEINLEEIVPGDMVYLEAGDMAPADLRIIKSSQLMLDESSLTGESIPVEKKVGVLPENTPLAERTNMLYKGTSVTKGNTYAMVANIGMKTELGKIANLIQSADQAVTPLEKKLEEFSKKLIKITVVLVIIIFATGLLNGKKWLVMMETSIALAVAAIPEGLPIVATLALAQGMLKMARQNVLVKKLSAVETLGGTNVICTDKTGTLTQNKIEVKTISTETGKIELNENQKLAEIKTNEIMIKIAVLCNTAILNKEGKESGDPLETGLLKFVKQQGISISDMKKKYPVKKEEPFSSETKIMSTMCQTENGYTIYAKGAVEELIKYCTCIFDGEQEILLDNTKKQHWLNQAEQMAASGLRVIAGAFKNTNDKSAKLLTDLTFCGLFGMIDPPREDVFDAIKECKTAGIKVIMITGDHPATAKNIALKLGIITDQNQSAIIGKDMNDYEQLSESEKDTWMKTDVFARVSPKQKLDLVTVLQDHKYIVGMTGDGVNDAPALKKADIGIAMGERGTQVAQDVADMILKDNSFSSIVHAIKQGRIIFENIRKFVIYLLSCNISELLIVSISSVLNLHFQLVALQILYINIITDVLQALALGITSGSDLIMQQPPRNTEEPIIDNKRWWAIIYYSIIISISSIGAVFISHYTAHRVEAFDPILCNNVLFFTLIFTQLLHVFNMGSGQIPFFKTEVFRNKYIWYASFVCIAIIMLTYFIEAVRNVLGIYLMSVTDWGIAIGMSFFSLIIIQLSQKLKIVHQ
ncbi:MAG: HAD-IC family P-type ATPase [Bacteroidia bacterium]|nr:HAD-IC family P-type ATPase [Bacteroidia bacterium]